MTYQRDPNSLSYPVSPTQLDQVFPTIMRTVYAWMFVGLLMTTAVALFVVRTPALLNFIFGTPLLLFGIIIAELALVVAISAAINRLSPGTALLLFFLYAALNGLTFSAIFLAYQVGQITLAFVASACLFAAMSIIGYTTRKDLSGWGSILFVALLGVVIASVVNIFLASSVVDWIITYVGVFVFLGLTVYDTQRIRKQTEQMLMSGGGEAAIARMGVLGALSLYLDFINLFLMILRLTRR